ncbi:MAG TPA: hypothetical protein VF665_08375 [Longimicrobium sp.]|jgi:hypothetical protein|uniref:hypothetical protein n=1 Tax=Longimicrobium sp. TaxID=2029185 RepID=UPI002ED90712
MRYLWSVLLLTCVSASGLTAQQPDIPLGTRVRIVQHTTSFEGARARRGATHTGTVQAMDSTSLTLLVRGQSLEYPLSIIERVEVSGGNASPGGGALHGVKRGAGIGAVSTGLVIGMLHVMSFGSTDCSRISCEPCPEEFCPQREKRDPPPFARALRWLLDAEKAEEIPIHMLRGAAVGGVMGAVVGSITRERWTPVEISGRPVPVAVTATGNSVGLTLRF